MFAPYRAVVNESSSSVAQRNGPKGRDREPPPPPFLSKPGAESVSPGGQHAPTNMLIFVNKIRNPKSAFAGMEPTTTKKRKKREGAELLLMREYFDTIRLELAALAAQIELRCKGRANRLVDTPPALLWDFPKTYSSSHASTSQISL